MHHFSHCCVIAEDFHPQTDLNRGVLAKVAQVGWSDGQIEELQPAMSEVSPSHSSGYWSLSSVEEQQEEEEESTEKQLDQFVWTQVEEVVQAFGPYGRLLSPKEEYHVHNVVYEEGIPHRVWLRIQTSAMQSFQQWIQRRFGETKLEPDHELRVGEFLLARYALDGFLYRAKVEEVDIVEGEVVVMVRFVDYGNIGEGLTRADLAPWSPYLSRIPPQVESHWHFPRLFFDSTSFSHLPLDRHISVG